MLKRYERDGTVLVIDARPDPVQPPDEITALKAEVAALRAAVVTVAQRSTPMTKAQAEALVSVAVVKA
jgi:hypothetical protein